MEQRKQVSSFFLDTWAQRGQEKFLKGAATALFLGASTMLWVLNIYWQRNPDSWGEYIMSRLDIVPFAKSLKYLRVSGRSWAEVSLEIAYMYQRVLMQTMSSTGQGWSPASTFLGRYHWVWAESSEVSKPPFLNSWTEELSEASFHLPHSDARRPLGFVANILKVAEIFHIYKLNVHCLLSLSLSLSFLSFFASILKELNDPYLSTPELGHFLNYTMLFKTNCKIFMQGE